MWQKQVRGDAMRKLILALAIMWSSMTGAPASAAMMYMIGGELVETVVNGDGEPMDDYLSLTFIGVGNGASATAASYAGPDMSFDYLKFDLASFAVLSTMTPGETPEILSGNYFFFTSLTYGVAGFGKDDQILFGGSLLDPYADCGCGDFQPLFYDGTSPVQAILFGSSLAPITFGGEDHMFDAILGRLVAGDESILLGVPEPASWGLMLVGFGTIGLGLRGRRPRLAHAA